MINKTGLGGGMQAGLLCLVLTGSCMSACANSNLVSKNQLASVVQGSSCDNPFVLIYDPTAVDDLDLKIEDGKVLSRPEKQLVFNTGQLRNMGYKDALPIMETICGDKSIQAFDVADLSSYGDEMTRLYVKAMTSEQIKADPNVICKPAYTQVYQPPLKLGGAGRVIQVANAQSCENIAANEEQPGVLLQKQVRLQKDLSLEIEERPPYCIQNSDVEISTVSLETSERASLSINVTNKSVRPLMFGRLLNSSYWNFVATELFSQTDFTDQFEFNESGECANLSCMTVLSPEQTKFVGSVSLESSKYKTLEQDLADKGLSPLFQLGLRGVLEDISFNSDHPSYPDTKFSNIWCNKLEFIMTLDGDTL